MNSPPIRNQRVGRVLHQLLRQTRERRIILCAGRIIIDGQTADDYLGMGVSILHAQRWLGWAIPKDGPPTAFITGSGHVALRQWDDAFPDNTDITCTAAEERALLKEAIRAAYRLTPDDIEDRP